MNSHEIAESKPEENALIKINFSQISTEISELLNRIAREKPSEPTLLCYLAKILEYLNIAKISKVEALSLDVLRTPSELINELTRVANELARIRDDLTGIDNEISRVLGQPPRTSNAHMRTSKSILSHLTMPIVKLLQLKNSAGDSVDTLMMNHGNKRILQEYFDLLSALKSNGLTDEIFFNIHQTAFCKHPSLVLAFYKKLATNKETATRIAKIIENEADGLKVSLWTSRHMSYYKGYSLYYDLLKQFYKLGVSVNLINNLLTIKIRDDEYYNVYVSRTASLSNEQPWVYKDFYSLHLSIFVHLIQETAISVKSLKYLLHIKSEFAAHIISLKDKTLLEQALDPSEPLGKFFWTPRGLSNTSLDKGTLHELAQALKNTVADNPIPPQPVIAAVISPAIEAPEEKNDYPPENIVISYQQIQAEIKSLVSLPDEESINSLAQIIALIEFALKYGDKAHLEQHIKLIEEANNNVFLVVNLLEVGNSYLFENYFSILKSLQAQDVKEKIIFNIMRFSYCNFPLQAIKFYQGFLYSKESALLLTDHLSSSLQLFSQCKYISAASISDKDVFFAFYYQLTKKLFEFDVPLMKLVTLLSIPNEFRFYDATLPLRDLRTQVFLKAIVEGQPLDDYHAEKENICRYILSLTDVTQKTALLKQSINRETALGRFFWHQRGSTKPGLNKGALGLLYNELEKISPQGLNLAVEIFRNQTSGTGFGLYQQRTSAAAIGPQTELVEAQEREALNNSL